MSEKIDRTTENHSTADATLSKRKASHLQQSWVMHAGMLMIADAGILILAYFLGLFFRFDLAFSQIPTNYFWGYLFSMPYFIVSTITVFYLFRLYHSIWYFASFVELLNMIRAYLVLIVLYAFGVFFMHMHMPRSYYIIGYCLSFMLHTGMRFFYRFIRLLDGIASERKSSEPRERVMIIGAGNAGGILIKELLTSKHLKGDPVCLIDDNPNKQGRVLDGIPVVGTRNDILHAVQEYEVTEIIYAIPTATAEERAEILNICKESGCKLKTVPGIYQLVNGEVSVSKLRDVDVLDLLGREPIKINNEEVFSMIQGKTILVTGGGGSIGSELCRQIARHEPKQLVIFDIYENNAYSIQQELVMEHPELNLVTLIGSCRNTHRISSVMQQYKPDMVFHAAAHKHVPLMEVSPNEAIKNNVMGTLKTARAAADAGVKRFVLISTDKAVNPTNVMGATKRICEMIVQMMNRKYPKTDFVAVRFGNVLGSNGSVIPLFKKQIAEGGPVTVTDKRIIRYFMTIPEAVSLVLQASHYAKGGEIFILDMGKPVKIDDMARNLIRLSGLTPDVDIKIKYVGLRPGEKLYEELLMNEEGMTDTPNKLIHIGHPIQMDDEQFLKDLDELDRESRKDVGNIRDVIKRVVPTYHQPEADKEQKTV